MMNVCLTKVLVLTSLVCYSICSTETQLKPDPRIVGGYPITISYAPFTVSVRLAAKEKIEYGSGHLCGGVVISQRLVTTAAHCCLNSETNKRREADEFDLVLGSTFLDSPNDNTQLYKVQELLVHEHYVISNAFHDIALMFINGYIPWDSITVQALPLNNVELPAGTECFATGWGALEQNGALSNNLHKVKLPLISYQQCTIGYGNIAELQLCAGYLSGGMDTCDGDSGGPLECNGKLVGLKSYGKGCALAGYPGVYTNISYYEEWIREKNATLDYTEYGDAGTRLGNIYGLCTILAVILIGMYLM